MGLEAIITAIAAAVAEGLAQGTLNALLTNPAGVTLLMTAVAQGLRNLNTSTAADAGQPPPALVKELEDAIAKTTAAGGH